MRKELRLGSVAVALSASALLVAIAVAGSAAASPKAVSCFAGPYEGRVAADQVVPGDLLVHRLKTPNDARGSICQILGTVEGNVVVADRSAGCNSRPPFTAVELVGGTVEGNIRSVGGLCAMIWLRDGTFVGGSGASRVDGNVIHHAGGNLGFLGNGPGAIVGGDAVVHAGGLFATGASNTNLIRGDLVCAGGVPAGGAGTGTSTNWDGIETATDAGPDGKILGSYLC